MTPRYAKLRASSGEVMGWENIELISDRPLETMLEEFKRLKHEFPDRWCFRAAFVVPPCQAPFLGSPSC